MKKRCKNIVYHCAIYIFCINYKAKNNFGKMDFFMYKY